MAGKREGWHNGRDEKSTLSMRSLARQRGTAPGSLRVAFGSALACLVGDACFEDSLYGEEGLQHPLSCNKNLLDVRIRDFITVGLSNPSDQRCSQAEVIVAEKIRIYLNEKL